VNPGVPAALTRYRIIALVVGCGAVILFFIGMPLRYGAHIAIVSNIIDPLHGFLYMVFLVATFDLARRLDWPYGRMLLTMLCGTIPVVAFYAEHRTTKLVRAEITARTATEPAATA
jgi:integral membrane protein